MAEDLPPAKRPKLDNAGDEKALLLSFLGKLTDGLNKVVEEGRKSFKESGLNEYLSFENPSGIRCLFRPMPMYVECMKAVGVRTRSELEGVWKGCFSDGQVQESVDDLLSAEERYEEFVAEVDQALKKKEDVLDLQTVVTLGDRLPADLSLTKAKSGEAVSLESLWRKSTYTLFVLLFQKAPKTIGR